MQVIVISVFCYLLYTTFGKPNIKYLPAIQLVKHELPSHRIHHVSVQHYVKAVTVCNKSRYTGDNISIHQCLNTLLSITIQKHHRTYLKVSKNLKKDIVTKLKLHSHLQEYTLFRRTTYLSHVCIINHRIWT